MIWLRGKEHRITDRDLLQEAVTEWKLAGEPDPGPSYQIFEQQAAQGYYDDAMATARLFKRVDAIHYSITELAKIRVENGDIQGAKDMIKRFAGSELGVRATEAIALAQVRNGDLRGALETAQPIGDSDRILLAFARRQIANGDFDGALKSAEQLRSDSATQLFYEVGDALRVRGEQKRVRELASHMSNRKLASLFLNLARFTLSPGEVRTIQATPCDIAYFNAAAGRFDEAEALIDQGKCSNVSFVAIRKYTVDPVGAERLLRTKADPQDLAYGLDQLAVAAAQNGNIAEALRFFGDLQALSRTGNVKNVVLTHARNTDAVHEIARAWTIKDGPKRVLRWVRSRSNGDERTWGLIGMAEALGHARPQQ
jgi:tetratricopeptide (TPR) repeat protein